MWCRTRLVAPTYYTLKFSLLSHFIKYAMWGIWAHDWWQQGMCKFCEIKCFSKYVVWRIQAQDWRHGENWSSVQLTVSVSTRPVAQWEVKFCPFYHFSNYIVWCIQAQNWPHWKKWSSVQLTLSVSTPCGVFKHKTGGTQNCRLLEFWHFDLDASGRIQGFQLDGFADFITIGGCKVSTENNHWRVQDVQKTDGSCS